MVYSLEKFILLVSTFDMAQPTQTDPQFKLRLPAALKERIESAASENNRSMNAEIVAALEEKFPLRVSIDEFFDTWIQKLNHTRSREQQEQLIVEADAFLKANVRPGVYVWLESLDENEPYVAIFGNRDGELIRPAAEYRLERYRGIKSKD